KLEKELKKSFKKDGKNKHQAINKTDLLEDNNIDEMWEIIQKAIQRAAENTLSKKKRTPKLLKLQPENKELKSLKRDIKTTGKWCRKLKKLANIRETTTDREDPTDKLVKE
ncbi:12328_t:CDS:1, partial [Dentiscutata heterogama]